MQQRLNCYAVINEKYRKPNAAKSEPAFDLDREICDLNRLDTYRDTPLYEAFVGAIVKFTRQITASGKAPYIFHLHGIRDNNIEAVCRQENVSNVERIGILIGTGRGNPGRSLSAPQARVSSLIKLLKNERIFAHSTTDPQYTAKKKYNLNQLFKVHYPDLEVNSFQFEIKDTGFRDTDANGSKTARRLAATLLNMVGEIPVVEPELVEPEILPAVKKDQIDLAVDTILDIYQKAAHEAMFGIGEYLIRTFFKGDYASAVNPRNIKDNSSLRKLHIKLGERTGIKPSKTWVYDSLKVTADKHLLGDMENFRTYGNLSLSHKIRLAYVSELKEKEALIERCSKENWTVRQLEEAIRGPADKTVQPAILKLVVKPEQFVTKYDGDRFRAALKRSKPKQVATLKNKVKKQIREMDQQLEDIRHFKSFYEQLFED
jgi:hypothetical protein